MSDSINRVTLVAHLGRLAEIHPLPNGARVANLSVATSQGLKDPQTGEWKERTEWHRIAVFGRARVRLCEKELKPGCLLYIDGRLNNQSYTGQDGIYREYTQIAVEASDGDLRLLSPAPGKDDDTS